MQNQVSVISKAGKTICTSISVYLFRSRRRKSFQCFFFVYFLRHILLLVLIHEIPLITLSVLCNCASFLQSPMWPYFPCVLKLTFIQLKNVLSILNYVFIQSKAFAMRFSVCLIELYNQPRGMHNFQFIIHYLYTSFISYI